ncbi:MAG TPA: DUF4412 domain-containing protein [Gemmatimonadales bacterium]|nr:DUF4412 domain-containing protein [Gemmatimonadales bacterium]
MSSARIAAAFAAAALAASTPVLSAQGFEGTVHTRAVTVSRDKLSQMGLTTPEAVLALSVDSLFAGSHEEVGVVHVTSTYYLAPGKISAQSASVDTTEPSNYMIMDADAGTMDVVMPLQKVYVEWTADDFKKLQAHQQQPHDTTTTPITVTALHRTAVVNGFRCSLYRAESAEHADGSGREIVVGCLSSEHKDVSQALKKLLEGMSKLAGAGEGGQSAAAVLAQHGLPIRIQTLSDSSGTISSDYDVEDIVAVTPGHVPAERFTPPAGFTKTSMADLIKQETGQDH